MIGVYFRKDVKLKPYCIMWRIGKKRKHFYFTTEEEAIRALQSHKQERVDATLSKRQALSAKRAADVAKHADSMALERRIAIVIVNAWKALTGRGALVLNDGTRGDVLLEREDGLYLVVQLKTTHRKVNGGRNGYRFHHVTGYNGMPVLCFCESDSKGWIVDGTVLDLRKKKALDITPGTPLERKLVRATGSMDVLVEHLNKNIDLWDSSTEDAARHGFESKSHEKEMKGIDAYKAQFPENTYAWPLAQNGHVDLFIKPPGESGAIRSQFKTARVDGSHAGFQLHLSTSAGSDENGKRIIDPYPHDAFDVLIVAYEEEEKQGENEWHFWRIPATELTKRGYLSTPDQRGKTGIRVFGPIGKQPDPGAHNKADTWTRQYYAPFR